jgi:hypothetical protein
VRTTLGDAKESSLPAVVGMAACDPRFIELLNEAQQRLVQGPELWFEILHRYQICVTSGCITWPRHIASIQTVAVCDRPMPLRSEWFEFLESGYGLRCCPDVCDSPLIDRGTAVLFRDVTQPGRELRLYADKTENANLSFGIMGYDHTGNWVRTQDSLGTWRDGEWLSVPTAPNPNFAQTSTIFRAVTNIIKPITHGILGLYQFSSTSGLEALGFFEHDETRPMYRRSFLPAGCCACTESDTSQDCGGGIAVTVLARREFLPAYEDTDWLIISNLPAIKMMMQAIQSEERRELQIASGYEAKARDILDREARHYLGNPIQPLRMEHRTWGVGSVPQLY